MKHRILALSLVAGIIALPAIGQEKKENLKDEGGSEKLVGTWEMQDADLAKIDGKASFEFSKDGKAKMSVVIGRQQPVVIEGAYKLDDKKLTLTAKKDGKDATEVVEVKSISDTELVLVDKQKKEVKFKKPEPKMPKDPLPMNPFPKNPFPMGP